MSLEELTSLTLAKENSVVAQIREGRMFNRLPC
jgi:hypothetical protein